MLFFNTSSNIFEGYTQQVNAALACRSSCFSIRQVTFLKDIHNIKPFSIYLFKLFFNTSSNIFEGYTQHNQVFGYTARCCFSIRQVTFLKDIHNLVCQYTVRHLVVFQYVRNTFEG